MSNLMMKSLIAAVALGAGVLAAPLSASAGGYGYGYSYDNGYHSSGYNYNCPKKHCYTKTIRYYDEYYNTYRYKQVRYCD